MNAEERDEPMPGREQRRLIVDLWERVRNLETEAQTLRHKIKELEELVAHMQPGQGRLL